MNSRSGELVQKLWSLCHVLRDDGMVYNQYMIELSYLLFLKLAAATGREEMFPDGCSWKDLMAHSGSDQLGFYRIMLTRLGEDSSNPVIRDIFSFPTTVFTRSMNLRIVAEGIDRLEWNSSGEDEFADLYEGLLEKNAIESKSGAGQYFTPRALIESIVSLMKPRAGEIVQDPAAGTGGFLVSAWKYAAQDAGLSPPEPVLAVDGVELVQDTHRLCLMNLFVHGVDGRLLHGDALSADHRLLRSPDLVLTNPPFGTKRGGGSTVRSDLPFPTNNKQLAFLQHVYMSLKPSGRAAVVVPDNVLFEEGVGARIRSDLMDRCRLHTILRLPTGIFYAPGVKTNVLFFSSADSGEESTDNVWVYDLRTDMPVFSKRKPFTREHLRTFEAAFGADPHGRSLRVEDSDGRFRRFSRESIAQRGDNLDITWLSSQSATLDDELTETDEISAQIAANLYETLADMEALSAILEGQDLLS